MKLKALVVDDSGIMRKIVMKALNDTKLAEFEFVEAEDGADALTKFDPMTTDIAFVDWNMPNMTGVDFVRAARAKLRTLDFVADTPMVMVTSEKTMGKVQEALDQAGADAFISKPFTVEEMTHKLKKVVDKAEMQQLKRYRETRRQQAPPQPAGGFWSKVFG